MPAKLPAVCVGHGAPTLALDPEDGAPLRAWGQQLPRPRAALVVSAHWEQDPVTLGAVKTSALVYDFYGFSQPLNDVTYQAPGAPCA